MKKKSKTEIASEALETAYWIHWCGDVEYARKMLIRITDFVCNEENNGQGQQKISLWK